MSDGLFNSSSSSSSSYHSYNHYHSDVPTSGAEVLLQLFLLALFLLLVYGVRAYFESEERRLDKTTYAVQAADNLERWIDQQGFEVKPGTLWIESGSSHRDNYHCKGGSFVTEQGQPITFCCAVEPRAPLCMVIY